MRKRGKARGSVAAKVCEGYSCENAEMARGSVAAKVCEGYSCENAEKARGAATVRRM